MIKHGASHGFSVLICTIIAAFIIELTRPFLPQLTDKMSVVSEPLVDSLKIPFSVEFLNIILLAVILAIIWGMFFKKKFVK